MRNSFFLLFFVLNYFSVSAQKDSTTTCTFQIPESLNATNCNDIFYVRSNCEIDSFHIVIYNHWGEKTFVQDTLGERREVNWKLQNVPKGVYVWMIEVRFKSDPAILMRRSGDISIIR